MISTSTRLLVKIHNKLTQIFLDMIRHYTGWEGVIRSSKRHNIFYEQPLSAFQNEDSELVHNVETIVPERLFAIGPKLFRLG